MDEREYIIENTPKEEWTIFGIDWCPNDMVGMQHDAIIFGEDKYNEAMELLRQE